MAMGPYGPQEILPETGLGGFSAAYDPARGKLVVTMRTGIHFVSPVTESGDPTQAKFQPISDWVKQNPELLPDYRWSDEAMATYEADLRSLIEQQWGGKFAFSLPWDGWEEIRAAVEVDIQLVRTEQRLEGQHLFLEVVKLQPGSTLEDEHLRTNTQPKDSSRNDDQTMQLGSNDLGPRAETRSVAVWYEQGEHTVNQDGQDKLAWLAEVTRSDPSFSGTEPFSAEVVGYASEQGDATFNQVLSEQRAQGVATELERLGFSGAIHAEGRGEEQATGNASHDRRTTVIVGDGRGQNAAIHEFGHAFGLGDEYETPRGPTGSPATHDDLVKRMRDELGQPLPGAIHEPNEGVMSHGDEIRPQHYATFFQALTDLTGIDVWRIGSAS
jgi:outer membrane protein OmpA-like peptidoglycan-associated protein